MEVLVGARRAMPYLWRFPSEIRQVRKNKERITSGKRDPLLRDGMMPEIN
jgi:hypothetical protein